LKEAQPIADAGSLNIEASQATRRSAADGGESARDVDAQPDKRPLADAGRDSVSPESATQLAAEDADRFAMAFRPSWEPVAPVPTYPTPNVRFRSFAPSLAPVAPYVVNDAGGFLQDDLLRLRAARVRLRSLALAAVSILSFGALMYWGISSTTDGAEHSAARGLQPPPAAVEPTEATEVVAPIAPAAAPELNKLSARLADPNAPPAAPAAAAAVNEARETETETQAEAAQPSATAAAEPSAAPTTELAKPTAASPDGPGTKPSATITNVKPATASAEVKPAEAKAAAAMSDPRPASQSGEVAVAAAPRPLRNEAPQAELPQTAAAQNTPASALKTATTAETAAAAKSRPPLLVVRAVPDSAQLFLDGQAMSNPFDTRLPLSSKHKIDARQDGYETSSQSIRLESDAKLTITLKRTTPAPEPHLKVRPLSESPNGAGFVTSNPY
jgi:hypothetical protein